MDQLACMRTFARVAELKSFTKAADALDLSRAVVSTQIAELERHLGARLFHRTTRRVSLTADGTEYLERCTRILAELAAADEARATQSRAAAGPAARRRAGRVRPAPADARAAAIHRALSGPVARRSSTTTASSTWSEEQLDVAVRVGADTQSRISSRAACAARGMLTCASPAYLQKHGMPQDAGRSAAAPPHRASLGPQPPAAEVVLPAAARRGSS